MNSDRAPVMREGGGELVSPTHRPGITEWSGTVNLAESPAAAQSKKTPFRIATKNGLHHSLVSNILLI